jgi:hypothetical protein
VTTHIRLVASVRDRAAGRLWRNLAEFPSALQRAQEREILRTFAVHRDLVREPYGFQYQLLTYSVEEEHQSFKNTLHRRLVSHA